MISVPTTTVTILGDGGTDSWGDQVDGDTVLASGIPASVLEQRRLVTTPDASRVQTILYYTGRLPHGTVVSIDNRLLDERTGHIYIIDSVSTVGNPVIKNDVRLDLRRVTV